MDGSSDSDRQKIREFMWAWDPYGVADDRAETPMEYEDWVDELQRLVRAGADFDQVRSVLTDRVVEEGLGVAPGLEEKLRVMLGSMV